MGDSEDLSQGVLLGMAGQLKRSATVCGILCAACGEVIDSRVSPSFQRIDQGPEDAFEYITLEPGVEGGQAGVAIRRAVICNRDTCKQARENATAECNAMRPFQAWTILPNGPWGNGEVTDGEG